MLLSLFNSQLLTKEKSSPCWSAADLAMYPKPWQCCELVCALQLGCAIVLLNIKTNKQTKIMEQQHQAKSLCDHDRTRQNEDHTVITSGHSHKKGG